MKQRERDESNRKLREERERREGQEKERVRRKEEERTRLQQEREEMEAKEQLEKDEKQRREREKHQEEEEERELVKEFRPTKEEKCGGQTTEESRGVKVRRDDWPPLREAELDDIASDEGECQPLPRSVTAQWVPAARPVSTTQSAAGLRSVPPSIPQWLRQVKPQQEEVEFEVDQEDLGSIWLAELYMGG